MPDPGLCIHELLPVPVVLEYQLVVRHLVPTLHALRSPRPVLPPTQRAFMFRPQTHLLILVLPPIFLYRFAIHRLRTPAWNRASRRSPWSFRRTDPRIRHQSVNGSSIPIVCFDDLFFYFFIAQTHFLSQLREPATALAEVIVHRRHDHRDRHPPPAPIAPVKPHRPGINLKSIHVTLYISSAITFAKPKPYRCPVQKKK